VQRIWLFFYGIASGAYRVFVGVAIILMVMYQIPVIGVLMAIGGVATWLCVPTFKLFKYLTVEPELHRKRGRAWAFTLAVTAAVVFVIGFIPFPLRVRGEGILEPTAKAEMHVKSAGFVQDVKARNGQRLKAGDVIMVLRDEDLETKVRQLRAQVNAANFRREAALTSENQNQAIVEQLNVQTYQKELDDTMRRYNDLTIKAPIDGYLVCPEIEQFPGRYLNVGDELCTVQETNQLRVKGTIDQGDAELITTRPPEWTSMDKPPIEVRTVGDIKRALPASDYEVTPGASAEIPHPALTNQGGGEVVADPKDPSGRKAANPEFELHVYLDNPNNEYVPGQRAYVRMTIRKKPLIWQWERDIRQLIQSRKEHGSELAKY
jgi:putative peptide zinc metalloprotease protein